MPDTKPENPPALRCECCGRMTAEGLARFAENAKRNPIYGTNLDRPKHIIINEIRDRIASIRGAISDFQSAFPGWKERTDHVEGALTCALVALYESAREMQAHYEKFELKIGGAS